MSGLHNEIVFKAWSCRLSNTTLDFLWSIWSWHILNKLSVDLHQVHVRCQQVPFKSNPHVPTSAWMHKSSRFVNKILVDAVLVDVFSHFLLIISGLIFKTRKWKGDGPTFNQKLALYHNWLLAWVSELYLKASYPSNLAIWLLLSSVPSCTATEFSPSTMASVCYWSYCSTIISVL